MGWNLLQTNTGDILDIRFQWAISRILETVNSKFFGDVTLKFNHGKIVEVSFNKKEQPKDFGIE